MSSASSTPTTPTPQPMDLMPTWAPPDELTQSGQIYAHTPVLSIPLSDILANSLHPRHDATDDLEELVMAYQSDPDAVQPITVSPYESPGDPEHFVVVKGHRRFFAAARAGEERVNCHVLTGRTTTHMPQSERLWHWLTTTTSAKRPTLEQIVIGFARYVRACEEEGVEPEPLPTERALAEQLGVGRTTVQRALLLADEPDEVIEAIEGQVLSAAGALELIERQADPNQRSGVALAIMREYTGSEKPLGKSEIIRLTPPPEDPASTVPHGSTMPPALPQYKEPHPAVEPPALRQFAAPAAAPTAMAFPRPTIVSGSIAGGTAGGSTSPTGPVIVESQSPVERIATHLLAVLELLAQVDLDHLDRYVAKEYVDDLADFLGMVKYPPVVRALQSIQSRSRHLS